MAAKTVEPRFKQVISCACGCGEGTPQSRPFKDGSVHIRGCVKSGCRKCLSRNNRRKGGVGQRKAMNRAGVPKPNSLATGQEEFGLGAILMEIKAGSQCRPLITAFNKAKDQSDAARRIGDHRPFVMGAVPQADGKEVIYAFTTRSEDDLKTVIAAWAEQLGLIE